MSFRCRQKSGPVTAVAAARGFTLVELLVTLSILAVLLALAVPSLQGLINGNRLTGQANELVASLQLARSEAIRLNTSVTLCRSTDGATCAAAGQWDRWITMTVAGAQVLRDTSAANRVQITSQAAAVTFRSDGLARDATGGLADNVITVCLPVSQPAQNQREVQLEGGSRVSTEAVNGGGACP